MYTDTEEKEKSTNQINLIEIHLQRTPFLYEMCPGRPIHSRALPIFELVAYCTIEHNIIRPVSKREDFGGFMGAFGDFLPHSMAHFDDAYRLIDQSLLICAAAVS